MNIKIFIGALLLAFAAVSFTECEISVPDKPNRLWLILFSILQDPEFLALPNERQLGVLRVILILLENGNKNRIKAAAGTGNKNFT